jgi:hypothetical protein
MFSKMFLFIQFFLLVLVVSISSAILRRKIEEVSEVEARTILSLVQSITQDPEYLALSYQEQYGVIETLLEILLQQNGRN